MADASNQHAHLRVPHSIAASQAVAQLDLSRPEAAQRLASVAGDWLYERLSAEGKRKLLAQHQLLAA